MLHSYRNQSIDLPCRPIDWFLYDCNIDLIWVNRGDVDSKILFLCLSLQYYVNIHLVYTQNFLKSHQYSMEKSSKWLFYLVGWFLCKIFKRVFLTFLLGFIHRQQFFFQDPDSRFTFCQKYNSATLVPVSVDKLSKLELQKSKSEWKTMNGFIYPGMKSAIESNIYPVQLHPSRKEEIELVCDIFICLYI